MFTGRPAALLAVVSILVAGLSGAAMAAMAPPARPQRPLKLVPAPGSPSPLEGFRPSSPLEGFRSIRTYAPVTPPVRLRIPAVGVSSWLQRVGRRPDGQVAVPANVWIAGWYSGGPRPGQPGPAVIVGHVDSVRGPGVFFELSRLSRGALVYVDRTDGSTARFRVVRISRVPKVRFPTDLVYSPTLQPSLQLITCGGQFDEQRRSYRDNVIVYTAPA